MEMGAEKINLNFLENHVDFNKKQFVGALIKHRESDNGRNN